jgi:hypothetical protein
MADQRLVAIAATTAVAATAASTAVATASAAATTTAVAAPAATTAAAEATTSAATATAAALFARAGFVDGQRAAAMFLAVERADRRLGFLIGAHLDEAESFGSAGVAIVDDLGGDYRPMLSKQLLEFRAIDLVAQVANV